MEGAPRGERLHAGEDLAIGVLPVQVLEERAHSDVHGGRPSAPGPRADGGGYRARPAMPSAASGISPTARRRRWACTPQLRRSPSTRSTSRPAATRTGSSPARGAPLGTAVFEIAPPGRVATLRRVRGELEAYFVRLVEARRREPRDDLLSALVAAELEGSRLSFAELLAMLILLLVAGNETTTHLIGNAVLALLAHPEALAALRADPSRVPVAVEGVLRFSSPVHMV